MKMTEQRNEQEKGLARELTGLFAKLLFSPVSFYRSAKDVASTHQDDFYFRNIAPVFGALGDITKYMAYGMMMRDYILSI